MLGMLVCALALTSGQAGQLGQPANANVPVPPGTATVRGHVFAADTGQPLRKAQVRIMAGDIRESRLATTDAEGRFEFKEVRAARYTITASKGSYVGLSYGQTKPADAPKPLAILDNQTVERVDFSLPRGAVVTGRIVDEYGEPMADVQITAQAYQYMQGQRRLMPSGRMAMTNDIGEFRLFGVPPGQYYLTATWRSANPTNNAEKIAYAPMYFPGTENLAQAQRITLAAAQEVTDLVMALKPMRATRVNGTVTTSDGKPMGGVVMLMPAGSFGMMTSGGPIKPDGTFTIAGIAPGEYTLRAQTLGAAGLGAESATATITATGDDITDLRIVGVKPSTVSGRIMTDPAVASALPPAVQLMLMPIDPLSLPMGLTPTKMGDDGTFEMKSAPGRMRINLLNGPGWTIRTVRLNGTDVIDTGVEIKPNEDISGLEVELTNKLTTISGLVTSARGETLKDYSALAFAQDREKWKVVGRYQGMGRPDQDGRFKIAGLAPGDYYIVALDKIDPGQIYDPDFLDAVRIKATALSIHEGETKTVDLKIVTPP